MNSNNALNRLLLPNPLNHIPRLQIHQYRVPRVLYLVVQTFNLAECGLEAVPLCGVAVAPGRDCDGVGEGGVVAPEGEFGERRAAREEVEDGAYDGVLF